jgi:hypothetical protein
MCSYSISSADFSYNKKQRCKMIIFIDVLDMGYLRNLLDNLWMASVIMADGSV